MFTNEQAIDYLKDQKEKLQKAQEEAIEDLAKELERSAQKFIGSAEMIRKYAKGHIDENLIEQNTLWVADGIKTVNKLYEKLEVLGMLDWLE